MITDANDQFMLRHRELKPGYCYHITTRCNNREFRLTRLECRAVLLYAINISPGQKSLWDEWDAPAEEIRQVAEKFVVANCFDPKFANGLFMTKPENNIT